MKQQQSTVTLTGRGRRGLPLSFTSHSSVLCLSPSSTSVMLSDKTFPGKMQHTGLLTLDREPTQISVHITGKSNLGNQCYWSIYRSRNDSKDSCITKAHPSMGDSSQTGNLNHTTQPAGSSTAQGVSFRSTLVQTPCRQMICCESLLQLNFIFV